MFLRSLKKFIEQGKIRYVGLSNETPWGFVKIIFRYQRLKDLPRMMSIQNPYSLLK